MKQDPFARSCLALLASVAIWWGTSGILPAEAQPPVAEAVTTTATPQEPQRIPGSIPSGSKYWSIMGGESASDKVQANEALLDHAVGTINTMFYDNTGGAYFSPRDFYSQWRSFQRVAASSGEVPTTTTKPTASSIPTNIRLDHREGAVEGLRWLVGSLKDPFSKYLTREELWEELHSNSNGFLGTGAMVEAPARRSTTASYASSFDPTANSRLSARPTGSQSSSVASNSKKKAYLSATRVANLPVVTAVAPDSPAERAGLVVGDRIVGVGAQNFLGWTRDQVADRLTTKYNQKDYFGSAELTVAKPVYAVPSSGEASKIVANREMVLGYRQTRVRLPTTATADPSPFLLRDGPAIDEAKTVFVGGDAIVHYQLLASGAGSIFDHPHSGDVPSDDYKVGYIRLTRFSKASTTGYVQAIKALEEAGAQAYILDLRNNYGGVIQEAMLTASTLLRDPHAILCYTMNSRGGFTPHDAEEYIVDKRYPGYLLSSESERATINQVQKENPAMFQENGIAWDPPSSFASLHEQVAKRGIRTSSYSGENLAALLEENPLLKQQFAAQKRVVLLINEGTASAAEVFAAALHDNARTVALVGTKTYGKGLIQHTFPMPDGGGLRLTVAEYLTPALRHMTNVGSARFDRETGEFVGGGIRPDVVCESKQGIPRNIHADLCVGVALDALEEADALRSGDSADLSSFSSQLLGKTKK